jgi:predicted ribosome quality control (RQC) complex YloA/Tae2 family protein
MGKHSNIILVDDTDTIVDSIKHISHNTSSVREVLPGKKYIRPPNGGKVNPLEANYSYFIELLEAKGTSKLQQAIYQSFNGISPVLAGEICHRAGIAPDMLVSGLSKDDFEKLYEAFSSLLIEDISCRIYNDQDGKAVDFSVVPFSLYQGHSEKFTGTASETMEVFYQGRDDNYRIVQKTTDLRKLLSNQMERCRKKQSVYENTLKEAENREQLKIYGELLTAYIHTVEEGAESFAAQDFYNENETVIIPLDPTQTAAENAQMYFKQYNKQKRTYMALQSQIHQNNEEQAYLDSVVNAVQTAADETDIAEIRAELAAQGFIKAKYKKQANKAEKKSGPLRFNSSDGFYIYVGKNNTQNDELTLRFAQGGDIWMHTKEIAGSHIIIRTNNEKPPERTIMEGANLAAYYSKARGSSQVPVDYVLKKHVKKPAGAKPGFVIYDHHKTIYITPEEPNLET